MKVTPYNNEETKKEQVRDMFDAIAPKYDLLNHVLSMNIDKSWRRKLVNMVAGQNPATILDLATGTGDLAIAMANKLKAAKIIGADLSPEMLEIGKAKIAKRGLSIDMQIADAENLPFASESFDAVTAAFGVRNFEDLPAGITQMYRVLKPAGRIYVLEFSMPQKTIFAKLYVWYFKNILPKIGRLVSKDARAYTYLPESVQSFPYGEQFVSLMRETGFKNPQKRELTFGIATIYSAEK